MKNSNELGEYTKHGKSIDIVKNQIKNQINQCRENGEWRRSFIECSNHLACWANWMIPAVNYNLMITWLRCLLAARDVTDQILSTFFTIDHWPNCLANWLTKQNAGFPVTTKTTHCQSITQCWRNITCFYLESENWSESTNQVTRKPLKSKILLWDLNS